MIIHQRVAIGVVVLLMLLLLKYTLLNIRCMDAMCSGLLVGRRVYMKRENAGSWNSGLEKEQILENYSAQLQKS
ncbi:hypothetical protein ZWY2020_002414 [Hordeum vulgare]|nr:hypothetical protein ZWY2020_002414 [Hordeum vulgare]